MEVRVSPTEDRDVPVPKLVWLRGVSRSSLQKESSPRQFRLTIAGQLHQAPSSHHRRPIGGGHTANNGEVPGNHFG